MKCIGVRGFAGALFFGWLTFACGQAVPVGPPSESIPTTTLHVSTLEIVLDVVVTDEKGHAVTQLNQNDFKIYEDGVLQRVRSFTPPAAHTASPDVVPVNSSADLKRIGNAPVTILVLDELDTRFEDMVYARDALEKYLKHQPERLPQPTILTVVTDKKFDVVHDYTQDRAALLDTLKQHFPAYPYRLMKGGATSVDANERMSLALGSLVQIAETSTGTSGRKNVIWVGCGFSSISTDLSSMSGTRAGQLNDAIRNATQELLSARVTLNVIDPTIMDATTTDTTDVEVLGPQDLIHATDATGRGMFSGNISFADFAPATGGFAYFGRNDVDREIDSANQNGANYFTLTYTPSNRTPDPAVFRKIRIVLDKPGLSANTRTGYYAAPVRKEDEKPPAPSRQRLAFDMNNAALSKVAYNGVSMSANAVPGGYKLTVPTPSLKIWARPDKSEGVEVTVMGICFGAHDQALSHVVNEMKSPFTPGQQDFVFDVPMELPTKTTRVRFVVRDAASGNIGTIDVRP
jgi:VWFA-related protein